MNFILFGPPGIGKSTLLGKLKLEGKRAIDLEDVYPSRVRFSLPNQLAVLKDTVFIGGADLDPKRKYPNAAKVLLIANQDAYDERRSQRDKGQPGKANQQHHSVDVWKTDDFDFSIDTSAHSLDDTLQALLSLEKKGVQK